jgi:membrane protease YdiL (CAAX protease family)
MTKKRRTFSTMPTPKSPSLLTLLVLALSFCSNSLFFANGFATLSQTSILKNPPSPSSPPALLVQLDQRATSTSLLAARRKNRSSTQGQGSKITAPNGPQVNVGLVARLVANQALVGSSIWTGGPGFAALVNYANFDTGGLLLGVAGVVPLLLFSFLVENSEAPQVAGLNLSTNMVVLRLFGSQAEPLVALVVSAFMAALTGLVEEVTFRGLALPFLAQSYGNVLTAAALSTLLFAILHINPISLFKGGEATEDNLVLLAFQLVTGSIFAALFLTTNNLAVPIIAHALYDFYTLFKTHLEITSQMDYAQGQANMPSASLAAESKWQVQRGGQFVQEAREMFYLMDTNQDGVLSRKELRVALFSYGINLSKMDSAMVARVADLDQSGSIDFGEFLEFIGPSGSAGKAVKSALLGPV